jgi:prephenate dehydrogenase
MFARLLRDHGSQLCVADLVPPAGACGRPGSPPAPGLPRGPAPRFLRADLRAPAPALRDEIAAADLVILAVPEAVALGAVAGVAAQMRPGSLLADTLSVKSRVCAIQRQLRGGVETASLNPMFAPSLGFSGQAVAAVVERDGPRAAALLSLLTRARAHVIRLSADNHDRLTSVTQVLVHATVLAYALALAELDVDLAGVAPAAPPPYTTLMALVARITGGTPEVYWDIQRANPYAGPARQALSNSAARLAELADRGDETAFGQILGQSRDRLGGGSDGYSALCAALFQQVRVLSPGRGGTW